MLLVLLFSVEATAAETVAAAAAAATIEEFVEKEEVSAARFTFIELLSLKSLSNKFKSFPTAVDDISYKPNPLPLSICARSYFIRLLNTNLCFPFRQESSRELIYHYDRPTDGEEEETSITSTDPPYSQRLWPIGKAACRPSTAGRSSA